MNEKQIQSLTETEKLKHNRSLLSGQIFEIVRILSDEPAKGNAEELSEPEYQLKLLRHKLNHEFKPHDKINGLLEGKLGKRGKRGLPGPKGEPGTSTVEAEIAAEGSKMFRNEAQGFAYITNANAQRAEEAAAKIDDVLSKAQATETTITHSEKNVMSTKSQIDTQATQIRIDTKETKQNKNSTIIAQKGAEEAADSAYLSAEKAYSSANSAKSAQEASEMNKLQASESATSAKSAQISAEAARDATKGFAEKADNSAKIAKEAAEEAQASETDTVLSARDAMYAATLAEELKRDTQELRNQTQEFASRTDANAQQVRENVDRVNDTLIQVQSIETTINSAGKSVAETRTQTEAAKDTAKAILEQIRDIQAQTISKLAPKGELIDEEIAEEKFKSTSGAKFQEEAAEEMEARSSTVFEASINEKIEKTDDLGFAGAKKSDDEWRKAIKEKYDLYETPSKEKFGDPLEKTDVIRVKVEPLKNFKDYKLGDVIESGDLLARMADEGMLLDPNRQPKKNNGETKTEKQPQTIKPSEKEKETQSETDRKRQQKTDEEWLENEIKIEEAKKTLLSRLAGQMEDLKQNREKNLQKYEEKWLNEGIEKEEKEKQARAKGIADLKSEAKRLIAEAEKKGLEQGRNEIWDKLTKKRSLWEKAKILFKRHKNPDTTEKLVERHLRDRYRTNVITFFGGAAAALGITGILQHFGILLPVPMDHLNINADKINIR